MKVGIFGDSFGDDSVNKDPEIPSWIDYVRRTADTVDNYCEAGTNLWFSYKLFLKHNAHYDKVIFLVTWPGRIEINDNSLLKDIGKYWTVNNIFSALKNTKDPDRKKQLNFLKDYVLNIYDLEKELLLHNAILQQILAARDDIILYPCHSSSIPHSVELPLWSITEFENSTMSGNTSYTKYKSQGYIDARCCHMTDKNHKIVADMFINKLQGIDDVLTIDSLSPVIGSFEQYMKKAEW